MPPPVNQHAMLTLQLMYQITAVLVQFPLPVIYTKHTTGDKSQWRQQTFHGDTYKIIETVAMKWNASIYASLISKDKVNFFPLLS